MKNIIRTIALAAALTCAAGTAARAQSPAPEVRSNSTGVHLGLFVNRTVVRVDAGDLSGWDHGLGVGLHAGYHYTPESSVFVRLNVMGMGEGVDLTDADLGLRESLGRSGSALRPFAQLSFGVRTVTIEDPDVGIGGPAITVGGGVEYFISRTVALEGGLSLSGGVFTHGRSGGGGWRPAEGDIVMTFTNRLDLGVSWHP